jgi:putative transposase
MNFQNAIFASTPLTPGRPGESIGGRPVCAVIQPRGLVIKHTSLLEVLRRPLEFAQYGSDDWQRFCRSHSLEPSMSRRGNCWDNAVAESFFSSLKKERIRKRVYKTRELARADVFDYIEAFYNRTRRHSHLGGVSPEAFEQASA